MSSSGLTWEDLKVVKESFRKKIREEVRQKWEQKWAHTHQQEKQELEQKKQELQDKDNELQKRVQDKDDELQKKVQDLQGKEQELQDKEQKQQKKEQRLQDKEQYLRSREQRLRHKEQNFQRRENNLQTKGENLESKERRLQKDTQEVQQKKVELQQAKMEYLQKLSKAVQKAKLEYSKSSRAEVQSVTHARQTFVGTDSDTDSGLGHDVGDSDTTDTAKSATRAESPDKCSVSTSSPVLSPYELSFGASNTDSALVSDAGDSDAGDSNADDSDAGDSDTGDTDIADTKDTGKPAITATRFPSSNSNTSSDKGLDHIPEQVDTDLKLVDDGSLREQQMTTNDDPAQKQQVNISGKLSGDKQRLSTKGQGHTPEQVDTDINLVNDGSPLEQQMTVNDPAQKQQLIIASRPSNERQWLLTFLDASLAGFLVGILTLVLISNLCYYLADGFEFVQLT